MPIVVMMMMMMMMILCPCCVRNQPPRSSPPTFSFFCHHEQMRVDLPAGMPVVLVHSIYDSVAAQSLSEIVDGTLGTPLCEEKLLGRCTIIVSGVDALHLRF